MKRISKLVMAAVLVLALAAPAWATIKETFNAALQAHKQGQYQTAINYYSQIINSGRVNPRGQAIIFTLRGMAYRSLRQPGPALQDFYSAIKANRNYHPAYLQRAVSWAKQGKWDYALWDLNQALRLKPDYVPAYFNRSIVLYKKGLLDLAIADAKKALQINPNYQSARKVLAILQRKKNQMAQRQAPAPPQQGPAQFGGEIRMRSGSVPGSADFQQFLK